MSKAKKDIFKAIISLLCVAGIIGIWYLLNYLSCDNVTGIGLGNFILMFVGGFTIGDKIRKMIWEM